MAKQFTYRVNSTAASIGGFDTVTCFNTNHSEIQRSPIDNCFEKINNLNLIYVKVGSLLGPQKDIIDTQSNLILLGYISAVESYLREIIRKLIILDKPSRISSEEQLLNYGAAINYNTEMLPEALLERSSFASKKNISEAFKLFLGLKGNISNELELTLNEYDKICHLRHCVVHRFGKLGSNNAIKFGLDKHSKCLEKPLSLNSAQLFEINQICGNTVLVVNDFLFKRILMRTIEPEYSIWKWDLRKDKNCFLKYYNLFTSTIRPESRSNLSAAYSELKRYKKNISTISL